MSIISKRPLGPSPANAHQNQVEELHAFLLAHPSGLSWTSLMTGFQQPLPTSAWVLASALDAGVVRVDCSDSGLVYFAAEHRALPVNDRAAEAVLNYMAAHEDEERGSLRVTLALDKLVSGLSGFYSPSELLEGIETLRQESILWFGFSTTGQDRGVLTLVLSRTRHFTVVAHDDDAHQPLCFHVRAGSKEVALRKVRDSAYGSPELAILGITAGWIDFEPIPGHSSMLVENL